MVKIKNRIITGWIAVLIYAVVTPVICQGKAVKSQPQRTIKTVIITDTIPVEFQFVSENTTYQIHKKINLNGKRIVIPSNCVIKFKRGGSFANGSLVGNRTLLKGRLKGAIDDVVIQGTFINNNISSSVFKANPKLVSLINLVDEGGIVYFDSDVEHDGTPILITKSISIKGAGRTIRIQSNGIKSGYLLTIKGINYFKLSDVVVDGGLPQDAFLTGSLSQQDNFKWLICAEDCRYIKIENCAFKNLFYQMGHNPDYPYDFDTPGLLKQHNGDIGRYIRNNLYSLAHYAMISFVYCKEVIMKDNYFENINSEEGIFFLADNSFVPPVKSTTDSRFIAYNNRFESKGSFSYMKNSFIPVYSSLSSWITVAFGQCEIIGNEFGACQGSQLNAFCSNSVINNNIFKESKSGSIDLNECGFLGFVPENVSVSHNCAYNTLYFIQTSAGININIEDNIFDCSGIPSGYGSDINMFAFCNRSTNDFFAPLNTYHPINHLKIARNKSINALWFLCDWNYGEMMDEKIGLILDSNEVENRSTFAYISNDESIETGLTSDRPTVYLSSFKDVRITNNIIKGTGCPRVNFGDCQRKAPTFFTVIHPSKNSYLKDVVIENNQLESEYKDVILLTHLILDTDLGKKDDSPYGIGYSGISNENNIILTKSHSD